MKVSVLAANITVGLRPKVRGLFLAMVIDEAEGQRQGLSVRH